LNEPAVKLSKKEGFAGVVARLKIDRTHSFELDVQQHCCNPLTLHSDVDAGGANMHTEAYLARTAQQINHLKLEINNKSKPERIAELG